MFILLTISCTHPLLIASSLSISPTHSLLVSFYHAKTLSWSLPISRKNSLLASSSLFWSLHWSSVLSLSLWFSSSLPLSLSYTHTLGLLTFSVSNSFYNSFTVCLFHFLHHSLKQYCCSKVLFAFFLSVLSLTCSILAICDSSTWSRRSWSSKGPTFETIRTPTSAKVDPMSAASPRIRFDKTIVENPNSLKKMKKVNLRFHKLPS